MICNNRKNSYDITSKGNIFVIIKMVNGILIKMKYRRIIANILVILLAFVLFAIWEQKFIRNTASSTSASLIQYYDVYLITTDEDYQFWQYVNQGAADMAALTGVKYYWKFPKVRSADEQMKIIQEAVDNNAAALVIAVDNPKRIEAAVEDAKARGVKVVYVDAPANEEAITTLATDNYAAGFSAGKKMISNLVDKGKNKGSVGIISIKGKSTTRQREDGFRDAFAKEPDYTILDTVYTNGKSYDAQLAAEQLISQNKDLIGLFGTNEGTSEGVGNANKANDNKYVVIAFDKSDNIKKLFDYGSIQVIIEQNPYTMGYLGMAEAIAGISGKATGPSYINTGYAILEKE
jgi:ABC-type sugar transport system, periplasmic component